MSLIEAKANLGNVGDFHTTTDIIVTKLSSALGMPFESSRIRRLSVALSEAYLNEIRAKAEASIIIANTTNMLDDIQHRAKMRREIEEANHQINIESILSKTALMIDSDSQIGDLQSDWKNHFLDKSKLVSDFEMQEAWARILAGEISNSGKFSKRTLDFLSLLEKQDAILFTKMCSYVWSIDGKYLPFLYNLNEDLFDNNTSYETLMHLEDIGLIKISHSDYLYGNLIMPCFLTYFDKKISLENVKPDGEIKCGRVILTTVGRELASICTAKFSQAYFDRVLQEWQTKGYGPLIVQSLNSQ